MDFPPLQFVEKVQLLLDFFDSLKGRQNDVLFKFIPKIILIYLISFFLIVKIETAPATIIYAAATPRPISLSLFSPKQLT